MPALAYVYRWDDALIPRIAAALEAEDLTSYRISLGPNHEIRRCLEAAINDQVIDSHLEAVRFTQGTEDRGAGFTSEVFCFDADTLHVLVRRLAEPLERHWSEELNDERILGEAMQSLASEILYSLDIPAQICG